MARRGLSVALIFAATSVTAAIPAAITWLSSPTLPGETILLHGAGLSAACALTVNISIGAGTVLSPLSGQSSSGSLKFALPQSLPLDAYALQLDCPGSPPALWDSLLNAAEGWWFQGDIGNAATSGGWLRVMGPVLQLDSANSTVASLQNAIREVRDAIADPRTASDLAWEPESGLAASATQLLALRAQLSAALAAPAAPRPVTLRLTPPSGSGGPVYIRATNASLHAAFFALDAAAVTPGLGDWAVAVANGYGPDTDTSRGAPPGSGTFTPVSFFESASRPAVSAIPILKAAAWPAGVFPVVGGEADPCILPCPTSDAALQSALAAAAAAGGGTVAIPRGRFFLAEAVTLPPNTVLVGAGAALTSVWFAEANQTTAPAVYIEMNTTAARAGAQAAAMGTAHAGAGFASWGLQDFTLYVTAFHNTVIYTSNATDGFVMSGMRLRINPYAFTWGPYTSSRGRWANWTASEFGNVVDLHGVNHRIMDNDIWGAAMLINSCLNNNQPDHDNDWPNFRRGHQYSVIARNTLWNGQASHFMQLWRQVLFIQNTIIGATEAAGGQSVGTNSGGMAQHIYHADNALRFTWGGDREVMTYDDAGGAYYGRLAAIGGPNDTVLTLAADAWPTVDWEMGGWYGGQVLVLNGTGALQIRRIVTPGVNTTPAPSNRTWVIDRPFAINPDEDSMIEIMPFRGRNIFHRDFNAETGPHQFYGHSVESVVTDVKMQATRGLIGWGQWRGWVPPPPPNATLFWDDWKDRSRSLVMGDGRLGGQMGNGMQPNVHSLYRGNTFTEGNHIVNYACGEAGYVEFWGGKSFVTYPSSVLNTNITGTPIPTHMGIVYRNNVVLNNGGWWIGNDTSDVVLEGSAVSQSGSECIIVGPATSLIFVADNNVCDG